MTERLVLLVLSSVVVLEAQTVRTVRAEEGCAVVLIEHDVGFVMRHSDRVVALNLGQILADASPEAVRNDPAVAEAYFGT